MLGLLGIGGFDTGGPVMGDYPASMRLRGAQDLSLTMAGAPTTWTIFVAIKRAEFGAAQMIASSRLGGVYSADFGFDASDQLRLELYNLYYMTTTGKYFRDPTNWLLITLNVTDGGAINCYVADQLVGTGTAPASLSYIFNSSATNKLGVLGDLGVQFLKGYMARFCYVAGSALSYTSFIEYDATANEWKSKDKATVKAVVDAGGADSRMYDWQDATSLTTLGYDYSAKGNNATLNGFSLTAGTSYDRMLDVPGNNFATFNPLASFDSYSATTYEQPSNGNLKCTSTGSNYGNLTLTQAMTSGKWYVESYVETSDSGVGIKSHSGSVTNALGYDGANSWGWHPSGNFANNSTSLATYSTFTTGDVLMMAYDAATRKFWIGKNGVWQNSGDPAAGTGQVATLNAGVDYFFAAGDTQGLGGAAYSLSPGQAPLIASSTYDSAAGGYFRYTPPTGFKALCQANMPPPAILNPEKHVDVSLYLGNGGTQTITGLQFTPGFVWPKNRSVSGDHAIFDVVRGVGNALNPNQTYAESSANGVTAFNSDGFSLGAFWNASGNNFVAWSLKAGGSPVTNNAGSISSQVSANVDAGFSIVKFTKTSGTVSAGHGLTKTPDMIVYKNLTTGDWYVYHKGLTNNTDWYLRLNSTSGQTNYAGIWGGAPTSSVIYCSGAMFGAGDVVAYCFHDSDILKVFSYLANASADGPYIDCGFKPKAIITKAATTTGNWGMLDAVRDPYNTPGNLLYPNLPNAEASAYYTDITSRGFKIKEAGSDRNASGQTYIGIAFADVPAKYSLAR